VPVPASRLVWHLSLIFHFFNEALLLMVALKQAGMGLVDLHFVLLVSAMVSSSSVRDTCTVNSSPNSFWS